jgi:crossover junction endodeoxyribonuclease RuvC
MENKYYIGIDPGFNGGIAILDKTGKIVEKLPMPILKLKSKEGSKNEYDVRLIASTFEKFPAKMVGLEIQQPMPLQGTVSMFKIGKGFGLLEGILVGLKVPYTLIKPKQWQSRMFEGLPKDDTKSLSILVAERIWPDCDLRKTERCSNPSDGISDSLLIAEFIRREYK